jgi:hypothetical protein
MNRRAAPGVPRSELRGGARCCYIASIILRERPMTRTHDTLNPRRLRRAFIVGACID